MLNEDELQETLQSRDIDAIVASDEQNVFYATGLKVLCQWLIRWDCFAVHARGRDRPSFVYPAVDANQVAESGIEFADGYSFGKFHQSYGDDLSPADERLEALYGATDNYADPPTALVAALADVVGAGDTVALELGDLHPDVVARVEAELGVEVVDAGPVFTALRRTKSGAEIERLAASVEITHDAIMAALEAAEEGMTERDLAVDVQRRMKAAGSTREFTVVGFGAHSAHCHVVPYEEYGVSGDRTLSRGDVIRVDAGCVYRGYPSDIARTVCFGEATEEYRLKYDVVHDANEKGISMLEPGVTVGEVFDATLDVIHQAGREHGVEQFAAFDRHHFGHGIGVNVYDAPQISPANADDVLEAGMVFNVETPYYELGTAGIQVEDTVVVREDGHERLSEYPHELRVVG